MTSLYSNVIILLVFQWIIKQDYKKKCLVTGDWSQSIHKQKTKKQKKKKKNNKVISSLFPSITWGAIGWCEGVVYVTSPGRPTDIGLQLGKACYPCSR